MDRIVFIKILLFCSLLFFSNQALAIEDPIATVSGVPITKAEVKRMVNKMIPFKVSFHSKISNEKIESVRAEAINELIERAYKICYARDEKIDVDDALVDAAMEKIRSHYKTNEAYQQAIAEETSAGLRASIYRELAARKAESVAVEEKINVTDADVENYYEKNKHTFFMPIQFRASHIMIKVDPASNQEERAELKAKAEALLVRAKNAEDFYNLAYYNSDDRSKYVGGDLGFFHEGRTEKPFEDALKQMQVGEISDLVKTRFGYHIIKLTEKNAPRQIPFSELRSKLRAQLEKEQREQYYQQWIDELKVKYTVEMLSE